MINKKKLLPGILILIFILHAAAGGYFAFEKPLFFLHDDGTEYLEGAASFAADGTFTSHARRYYEAPRDHAIPEIFRTSLLSFLTGVTALFVRNLLAAAVLVQAIGITLLSWALFRIGFRVKDERAGWIALLLANIHPLILVFSLRFSSELLFMTFIAWFCCFWLTGKTPWKYVWMGIAAGLASGIRPTALLFLPALGIYFLIHSALPMFRDEQFTGSFNKLRCYALFSFAFLLMIAPWSIRNYRNYGTWNPAGCLGGFNCLVGNNRENALAYRARDGKIFLQHQKRGWDQALAMTASLPENMSPVQQDKVLKEAAFREIQLMGSQEFIHMSLQKAWHFVRPWPLHGAHPVVFFYGLLIWEILLMIAGGYGIYLLRSRKSLLLFLLMIFCCGWTAHSLIHLQMRHRIPFLDLPLIMLASAAVSGWIAHCLKVFSAVSSDSGNSQTTSSNIGK